MVSTPSLLVAIITREAVVTAIAILVRMLEDAILAVIVTEILDITAVPLSCFARFIAMVVTTIVTIERPFSSCDVAAVVALLLTIAWDTSAYRVAGGNVFDLPVGCGKLAIFNELPNVALKLLIGCLLHHTIPDFFHKKILRVFGGSCNCL